MNYIAAAAAALPTPVAAKQNPFFSRSIRGPCSCTQRKRISVDLCSSIISFSFSTTSVFSPSFLPLRANPWIARLWLPSCVLDFGLHSGRRAKTKKSHIRHGPRALLALPTKYSTATFVDFLHGVQLCVQANVLYRHTDVYHYYYTCLICFFSCSFTLIGLVISSWRLYTQKMNG